MGTLWLSISLVPRPTLTAADGLHHRYARLGSGKMPNKTCSTCAWIKAPNQNAEHP